MEKSFEQKFNDLKNYLKNLEYINSSIALLQWDTMVNMPKDAIKYRSEMLGYLSGESYKLSTSEKIKEFIQYFSGVSDLDDIAKATIANIKREYDRTKKIPANEYKEYVMAGSVSGKAWEEAKEKSDFKIFQPHLEKMVEYNQ